MTAAVRGLSLLALFLYAPLAHADVAFEKAVPSADSRQSWPPSTIRVWFTEPLRLEGSALSLRGPSGPVALSGLHVMEARSLMASVEDRMPDGVYTVTWDAAATEGSTKTGEFSFTLKRVQ